MGGGVERREEENERECEREYSLQAERRNSSVYWGMSYYILFMARRRGRNAAAAADGPWT